MTLDTDGDAKDAKRIAIMIIIFLATVIVILAMMVMQRML